MLSCEKLQELNAHQKENLSKITELNKKANELFGRIDILFGEMNECKDAGKIKELYAELKPLTDKRKEYLEEIKQLMTDDLAYHEKFEKENGIA